MSAPQRASRRASSGASIAAGATISIVWCRQDQARANGGARARRRGGSVTREAERRAAAGRAFDADLPPMRSTMRREIARPSPVPPNLRVDAAVGLLELLEDARQRVRRDADTGVAHLEADLVRRIAGLDDERDAAGFGELHGVAGKIEQHLAQARSVAGDFAGQPLVDDRRRSPGPWPARAARAARPSPRPSRRERTAASRGRAGRPRSWRSRGFPRSATAACRRTSSRPWRKSVCSGVSGVSSKRSAMPRMPLSGVRISWLTVARKRPLARLAASA